MLLKCYTQYVSKFGKLSSGHRTGKGQFSFQSQRRAMPKNVQITIQLLSFHTLVRLCPKYFKLGLSSMWTKNFQMYKLGLEKAEEQGIKLPKVVDHRKNKGIPEKHLFLLHWLHESLWLVWTTTNWKILKEIGISDHLICLLRNLHAGQEATIRTLHRTMDWFKIGKGVWKGCILSSCLFNLYAEYVMWNARLGMTSWNQDCWKE